MSCYYLNGHFPFEGHGLWYHGRADEDRGGVVENIILPFLDVASNTNAYADVCQEFFGSTMFSTMVSPTLAALRRAPLSRGHSAVFDGMTSGRCERREGK